MKKLSRLFTAFLFAAVLLVSGVFTSFADNAVLDDATVANIVESVITEVTAYSEEDISSSIELYESYGLPDIAEGFQSYLTLMPSLGEYQSTGTASYVQNEDGSSTITAPVTFSNSTVDFILTVGADGYISAFKFSDGKENTGSLGSKLKEAGINLIVGMGTVFLVLIFLCWIISLFKNISVIEKKLADRKAAKSSSPAVSEPAKNREVLELIPETSSDDEIQAVIAAAIAAYEAENGCSIQKQPALSNGITIKTYRRK